MPQSDEEDVRAREGAQASPRTASAGTQEGGSLTASRGLVSRLFGGLVSPRGGTASPESPRHDTQLAPKGASSPREETMHGVGIECW